jgi:hypothetical protein
MHMAFPIFIGYTIPKREKVLFFFILIPHAAFGGSNRDEPTYNTDTLLSVMPEIPKTISSANSFR